VSTEVAVNRPGLDAHEWVVRANQASLERLDRRVATAAVLLPVLQLLALRWKTGISIPSCVAIALVVRHHRVVHRVLIRLDHLAEVYLVVLKRLFFMSGNDLELFILNLF